MDSLNIFANKPRKKKEDSHFSWGMNKIGKYYFPGRLSSSCFEGQGEKEKLDRMGIVINSCGYTNPPKEVKNIPYETDELYDYPESSQYDPQGSYTGRPENVYETPVQDADDL